MSDTGAEWKIIAYPRGKDNDGEEFTIAYLPDKESAEIDAEGYAEMIERSGLMPPSYEAHSSNATPCALIRRMGKSTWLIRTDAWERETENGYDQGYGYLKVAEVFA